jgi:hypothetical protein
MLSLLKSTTELNLLRGKPTITGAKLHACTEVTYNLSWMKMIARESKFHHKVKMILRPLNNTLFIHKILPQDYQLCSSPSHSCLQKP